MWAGSDGRTGRRQCQCARPPRGEALGTGAWHSTVARRGSGKLRVVRWRHMKRRNQGHREVSTRRGCWPRRDASPPAASSRRRRSNLVLLLHRLEPLLRQRLHIIEVPLLWGGNGLVEGLGGAVEPKGLCHPAACIKHGRCRLDLGGAFSEPCERGDGPVDLTALREQEGEGVERTPPVRLRPHRELCTMNVRVRDLGQEQGGPCGVV